jgi:trigger factor
MTQVTETLAEGLKREFKIVVPAATLSGLMMAKLTEMKDRVQINGFRPGKVPMPHLKKLYGKSVMADVINDQVSVTTKSLTEERGFKLAMQPKVTLPEEQAEVEAVLDGQSDLSYGMAFEVLPKIEVGDFKTISLEKLVVPVTDAEIDEAMKRIADQNRPFEAKDGAAAKDDQVTMDYEGSIDGVPFDGGKDSDANLVLGSGMFIPGFEDQLIGKKAGDSVSVKVAFPADYQAANLAGKDAVFAVTVKLVSAPGSVTVDDAFAKTLGMESLDKLKDAIRDQIGRDYNMVSRAKVKRKLLDALDSSYTFELPPTLVDQEFEIVWRNVTNEMQQNGKSFADEDTTEEAAKADYRKIAERRVRLGLLLAEVGEKAQVQITDEEVNRALIERVRQFPGQERQVYDFYRNNPNMLAELRAPLFEEKVVDYILELANVTEKTVDKATLTATDEAEEAPAAKTKKPKKA